MSSLDNLKRDLRASAVDAEKEPFSDEQYSNVLKNFRRSSEGATYQNFIVPQLTGLLGPLFDACLNISVLEIGPGDESVLFSLPARLRRKIRRYVAVEPNELFAEQLDKRCRGSIGDELAFPGLDVSPIIHCKQLALDGAELWKPGSLDDLTREEFDVVLFCHSMYGMHPKEEYVKQAITSLRKKGIVVVFHRQGHTRFGNLVCHRRATWPAGVVEVPNDDASLDNFAAFVAGFSLNESERNHAIRARWREICRSKALCKNKGNNNLSFSAPEEMLVFNRHADEFSMLRESGLALDTTRRIKNHEARANLPGSIIQPKSISQIQQCVQWALDRELSLTVIGGSHSAHCLLGNVVAVDMSAFNRISIHKIEKGQKTSGLETEALLVVGAGCLAGEVIRATESAGIIVPLGARPSVGAGSWLQGGLGHLSRLYGLSCDAIVGAVLVSIESAKVIHIGHVPPEYIEHDSERPQTEAELLWAMKGAGTNFGIVVSVVLQTYPATKFLLESRITPVENNASGREDLATLLSKSHPKEFLNDFFLFVDNGEPTLGLVRLEARAPEDAFRMVVPTNSLAAYLSDSARNAKSEGDLSVESSSSLFDKELYMTHLHRGHGGGKTVSFKRCIFLKPTRMLSIVDVLMAAIEQRASPMCYLHLLHGGEAASAVAADATAFGCRDWDYACVVTGVWPRDDTETDASRRAVDWVYQVIKNLLPFSTGVYGADLGPDPRDAALAARAFGPNLNRLGRLKRIMDPHNVLAHACPLPIEARTPKLIVLVTGKSFAGKDYSADKMVATLRHHGFKAISSSISEATKCEYAAKYHASAERLLTDRSYREKHRKRLTAWYREQVRDRPWLPEDHLLHVVHNAPKDLDVLCITGLRDEAPVAQFGHLVPSSRMYEVYVDANDQTRCERGWKASSVTSEAADSESHPDCILNNDVDGGHAAAEATERHLIPFLQADIQRLSDMVCRVPDFPRPGSEFRHVLNIAQQPHGLQLCTPMLQSLCARDWSEIDAVVCCETGGIVFGSALAGQVGKPLVLVRRTGKLPPPTISVPASQSHISSLSEGEIERGTFEMGQDVLHQGSSVMVLDDVLASGRTLCSILALLLHAGLSTSKISVMVVAEFPLHKGRQMLRQHGYSSVKVQSLLVFDGA